MRNTRPFIKTARRGSAYCTQNGAYWIRKNNGSFALIRKGNAADGVALMVLGRFKTLREAIAAFMQMQS